MTDIIERSPMHNEDQLLKVADVIMALIEPRLKERIQQMIEENSDDMGTRQEDIDDQISNWMSMNFDLSDYSDFSIHDHEYEIGSMTSQLNSTYVRRRNSANCVQSISRPDPTMT